MANKIKVVGVGPGGLDYITSASLRCIEEADILVGGERVLNLFSELSKMKFIIKNNLAEMVEFIKTYHQEKSIAVLASGDPAFYGILAYLKKHFNLSDLMVEPGISSMQLACARLCITWEDAAFFSVHGRDIEGLSAVVGNNSKVVVLTDKVHNPGVIARYLCSKGFHQKDFYVCENLSYDDETIQKFKIDEVPADVSERESVVVIIDA